MKQVLLCGYYGMGNGGDEALLAALLQMLPAHWQPVALSANPAETEKLHGIKACDRWNIFAVLDAMKKSDVFVWGGGSLMQDTTSPRNPIYYGGLMGLAQGMGLKTIAWAQGIGPLQRPWSQWIARRAFAHCDRISVRDPGSARQLQAWQLAGALAPDPVWALDSEAVPHLWDFPAPRVAVVLRDHAQLTPARLACLSTALVNFQKATQTFVLLLPFQPDTDQAIAAMLHDAMPTTSKILIENNPRRLKGVFRGVEMAIAMRLHGLIMAAAEGCRCWALSYDPKVSRLMQETAMPGWELSDLPTDPQVICQAWLEHFANGEALSRDRLSSLRDRALIHQQVFDDTL